MSPDDFASLEISRYELRLIARQSADLPAYLGSTIRGAFGHALKEAVCVMSHRRCERCLVADRCIYPYVFDTPVPPDVPQLRGQKQAPHPFILTPPALLIHGSETNRDSSRAEVHHLSDGRAVRLVHQSEAEAPQTRRCMKAGEELSFGLTLIGKAVESLPYIVYAASEMAHRGLGVERARFELKEVVEVEEGAVIYTRESQRISAKATAARSLSEMIKKRLESLNESSDLNSVRLRFVTPTRIRVADDLQAEIDFGLLARSLLRRVSMLAVVHGSGKLELDYRGLIGRAVEVETVASDLEWEDWERYSNRQQTKMKLGGFTGEVGYAGSAIREFLPLIVAGEILRVGASTSFGLGRFEVAV